MARRGFKMALDDKISYEEYRVLTDEGRELARLQGLVDEVEAPKTHRRLASSRDINRVDIRVVKQKTPNSCEEGDIIRVGRRIYKCMGHKPSGEPTLLWIPPKKRNLRRHGKTGRIILSTRAQRWAKRGLPLKRIMEKDVG